MDFKSAFTLLTGFSTPLRWQARLYEGHFAKGEIPSALDLPTGLGKTSVMAVWLAARALGADALPRRLVYVVDRRAVVDQATEEAEKLREALEGAAVELKTPLGLDGGATLPISTLRGQHADNREWLADPAAPAIIVGTVDMIGSRLLFSGYGVSRRMRPYHAGLLGADSLIVLDEAHLVPPFEKLIETIANGQDAEDRRGYGPRDAAARDIMKPLRVLSLSATGRQRTPSTDDSDAAAIFSLCPDEDHGDEFVNDRLNASKALVFADNADRKDLAARLVNETWTLSNEGGTPARYLIFCHSRDDAGEVHKKLSEWAEKKRKAEKGKEPTADIELLTGARRVYEREQVKDLLEAHGFFDGRELTRPAFLIATSAGEVGVDMDADHMVSDLVEWERMVQRLGRVNRAGRRADTRVIVIDAPRDHEKNDEAAAERRKETRALLERLPKMEGDARNVSPLALLTLRDAAPDDVKAASTPAPLRPALTRALVDAWSMTSLEEHAGRPEVGPWLRGWETDERPQATIVWRKHLPVRIDENGKPVFSASEKIGKSDKKEIEDFFEAAPPHLSEKLETETFRIVSWLEARAKLPRKSAQQDEGPEEVLDKNTEAEISDANVSEGVLETEELAPQKRELRRHDIAAIVLSASGEYAGHYPFGKLAETRDNNAKKRFEAELAGKTVIVDARLGGLKSGMLDPACDETPETADASDDWSRQVKLRVRLARSAEEKETPSSDRSVWRFDDDFVRRRDEEGETEWLVVEHLKEDARREDARSISRPQALAEHQDWAKQAAEYFGTRLSLNDEIKQALALAAHFHDEGKRAKRWQRAFKAQRDAEKFNLIAPLAKTKGPIDYKLLDGYRHEFGSLPYVEKDAEFQSLQKDLKDLVRHLVAAHHGQARPVIETRSCDDAPPSALEERARDVALRFSRLQKRWGPWGLAWLETLLRAADAEASRRNDEHDRDKAKNLSGRGTGDGDDAGETETS